jgi:eukaryotic-like serine/threonine-protein kinase
MNGDSDREVAIFTEALKVSPQERDAFLDRRCGEDEEMRRRLEALLKAYDELGNFLEEPPTGGPSRETN